MRSIGDEIDPHFFGADGLGQVPKQQDMSNGSRTFFGDVYGMHFERLLNGNRKRDFGNARLGSFAQPADGIQNRRVAHR